MHKETSEIGKLTERVSNDPKSKLFVPLAEEYKKKGDLEMAIHVLSMGLKNNPDYVAARSFLGKLLIEQGELVSAQKEFEAVVKATPDNFMAQRKLGDLLILQNNPKEALKHYKIALTLNLSDEEFATIVSDVESGHDVREKIHLTKTTPSVQPFEQRVTPQPSAAEGVPDLLSIPILSQEIEDESGTLSVPGQGAQTLQFSSEPLHADTITPGKVARESEEAEEVLFVEPLEPETTLLEASSPGINFQVQQEEPVVSENLDAMNIVDDSAAMQPFSLEHAFAGVISEADLRTEETPENADEGIREEVAEKSDDFTTDTLAELYISQGFYEKAIDIYERMLADKPNSRGLKDKLERVRAAAAGTDVASQEEKVEDKRPSEQIENESVPPAQAEVSTDGFSTFEEPKEYRSEHVSEVEDKQLKSAPEATKWVPPVESEAIPSVAAETVSGPREFALGEQPSENNIFAEPHEYKPETEPEQQPTIAGENGFDVFGTLPVQEPPLPTTQQGEFEPREYVPPKAEADSVQRETEPGLSAQKTPNAGNKETIDRLETWLAHIKKEQ